MKNFSTEAIHLKEKFMQQINTSFGSGGMFLSFNNKELTEFVQYLKQGGSLPIKKAATHIGRQKGCLIWVFKDFLVSAEDGILPLQSAPYLFLGQQMLGDDRSKLHMNNLCPEIMLPLDDAPLKQLTHLLDVCMKHNFVPALIATRSYSYGFPLR